METTVGKSFNGRVSVKEGTGSELVSSVEEDESFVKRVNTVFSGANHEELADSTEKSGSLGESFIDDVGEGREDS